MGSHPYGFAGWMHEIEPDIPDQDGDTDTAVDAMLDTFYSEVGA